MKLTASNASIANTVVTTSLTIGNNSVVDSLTIGNTTINSSAISIGNVSIAPANIITPSLILGGGTPFGGGLFGGIVDYQEFTANGTWYNPYANASVNSSLTGYEQVLVMVWGGGGGGSSNNNTQRNGGGGACALGYYTLSSLSNTVVVTVGGGGTAARTTTTALSAAGSGGNTNFGVLAAYGGGGASSTGGGGGGGILSAGSGHVGGSPLPGTNWGDFSTFGGGSGNTGGTTSANSGSIFGGGAGGQFAGIAYFGGISVYGGGGGSVDPAKIGTSVFGGSGGGNGTSGVIPGGGGSANLTVANTGARGEVRVWVIGPGSTTAGAPTYTLTANTTTVVEGNSVLYTVSTTNVANNTTLYYTLNNSSTATSADFTTAVNGSVVINGGTGTFILTANNDADSANEAFQIDVRTNSDTGTIVASNGSVSIVPAPDFAVTYLGTYSNSTVGSTFTFNSVDFGTASSDREIFVVAASGDTGAGGDLITSITIAGSTATLGAGHPDSGLSTRNTRPGISNVASGTSGTVTVGMSFGATTQAVKIAVYSITGRGANKGQIDTTGAFGTPASASSYTLSPSGFTSGKFAIGIVLAASGESSSAPASPTWIEDLDSLSGSIGATGYLAGFYHTNTISSTFTSQVFSKSATGYGSAGMWVMSGPA